MSESLIVSERIVPFHSVVAESLAAFQNSLVWRVAHCDTINRKRIQFPSHVISMSS